MGLHAPMAAYTRRRAGPRFSWRERRCDRNRSHCDIVMHPELLPRPRLPDDGPQTPMDVLRLHEKQRQEARGFEHAQARMHACCTLMVHVCAGKQLCPSPQIGASGPSSPPPPLALLIASHVGDHERLVRLRNLLGCVAEQRGGHLSAAWLSWSAEDDLRPAVRTMLTQAAPPCLHAVEQPRNFRQFEHLAELTSLAAEALGEDAWATFSDDDDLLHPDRSAAYAAAIVKAHPHARALRAGWTARPRDAVSAASAADVDALMAQGRVVRTPELDANGQRKASCEAWDEYFNYAIVLAELRTFFAKACPLAVRRSMYADMVLHAYMRNAVPTARFEPSRRGFEANWAYLYDKPLDLGTHAAAQGHRASSRASSGVTPTAADTEKAAALKQLPGLQHESDAYCLQLAAQERSVYELFCTCFAGSPRPTPLKPFLLLGQLVALDHLEALGYSTSLAESLAGKSYAELARTALAFGVVTEPPIPDVDAVARAARSTDSMKHVSEASL